MPPEPLPWGDRRDFRKYDRSPSDPRLLAVGGFGGGGPHRWRDQHHVPLPHPYLNRHQQQQRWYSDFRSSRPINPGHGKQGGWHLYSDETDHGFMPFGSRYGARNLEEENWRSFGSRGDGRYIRNGRENRSSSFSQKDWKAPPCEPVASMSGPGRSTTEANNQRSVENTHTCLNNNTSKSMESSDLLESTNPLDHSHSLPKEEQHMSGVTGDGMTIADQKSEKENGIGSIDWKPMKWPRSGSLSSRGSGFSQSSSSKSMVVESMETDARMQQNIVNSVPSPSADAVACITSTAPPQLDEGSSRKKPRLGWGEGLAKYEKKKVEGPEDCGIKSDLVCSINTEAVQSHVDNLLDKSPTVTYLLDCASPATPSSVACSSSPGVEEKESTKVANADNYMTNLSSSPSIVSQMNYDGPTFNLEKLDISAIANLSTLINELISDDPSSAETGYIQTSLMNKLLLWKVDVLKALELTESEIDSLETELKSLITEPKSCPASYSSFSGEFDLKSREDQDTPSNLSVCPASLETELKSTITEPKISCPASSCLLPGEFDFKSREEQGTPSKVSVSFGDMIVENMPVALESENILLEEENIDSPGSATSEFVEDHPAQYVFPAKTADCVEVYMNLNSNNSSNFGEKCLENAISDEEIDGDSSSEDFSEGGNMCYHINDIYDSIIASNKDSASRALEELNKLLPCKQHEIDTLTVSQVSSLQKDLSVIRDRFLKRKHFIQFKEKVVTLKFKVFQHFWKEGRIVSVRKLRIKSHKKFDLSRTGHKKNRSFSRLRSSCSAGSPPQTVPPDEVIEFINKLLLESAFKPYRNSLKMPALILDKEEKMMSSFISNNGLVEDPCAAEKERCMINPWTSEEMGIFIDKLAIFGKDFKKISSFLDHKTIADCVEFYYKNHKSDCFEKARKKPDFTKQRNTTYLLPGKRWNREQNAVSLDMLGAAASVIVANVDNDMEIQQKGTSGLMFGTSSSLQRSESMDMSTNERETIAADVLAGICGSISSEAMSSCITSSADPGLADPGDGFQELKYQRFSSTKRALTPEVTQTVDECSDESCGEMDTTDWNDEEKSVFIQALSSYGKDFVMISQAVRTRSRDQCRVFFSKAKKILGLDLIQHGVSNTLSGDVNGGGSDIEDACVSDPGCKMEEDNAPPYLKLNQEAGIVKTQDLRSSYSKVCEENYGPCLLDPVSGGQILDNSLMGDKVDDKPVTDFNMASKERIGANDLCVHVQEFGTSGVEDDDNALPNRSCEAENNDFCGIPNVHCREEKEGEVTGNILDHKEVEENYAKSIEVNGMTNAVSEIKSSENVSHPSGAAKRISIHVDKLSEGQKKAGFESSSAEKSPFMPLQKNGHLTSVKSSTLFSVPIKYQKHSQRIVRAGDSQQQQSSSYSLSDPVKPAQILRGYPVSMQTMKDMNGDVSKKRSSVSLQNFPKRDGVLHSDRNTDFSLQRCNRSRHQKAVEALFTSREQGRDHSRPHSGSDGSKPRRNGDVKLFGKILVSSQEKLEYCAQQAADDYNNRQHRGFQSLNLKFNGDPKVNLDSAHQSKFDRKHYIGSENIPITSFGFWEGNGMQKGFPSLSDSARLLTKYPAAFSNYTVPTRNMEQPFSLHGSVKYTDYAMDEFSVFPTRELNSSRSGLADYQRFRNREVQPPFSIDIKQSHDALLLSEMQRRNGFDLVSGMQQETRGMVGGIRGGVLVGGQCSSAISDPVAAIRRHYAQSERFSVHLNDDDKWRSNGNVGRR